jgi:hypothetical protein
VSSSSLSVHQALAAVRAEGRPRLGVSQSPWSLIVARLNSSGLAGAVLSGDLCKQVGE